MIPFFFIVIEEGIIQSLSKNFLKYFRNSRDKKEEFKHSFYVEKSKRKKLGKRLFSSVEMKLTDLRFIQSKDT